MQWIIEYQSLLYILTIGVVGSAGITGWWMKQKMRLELSRLQQQLDSREQLHEQELSQVMTQLRQTQADLHESEDAQDLAMAELRQLHGQHMASVEKLGQMAALQQERAQLSSELTQLREQKAQLQAQLREQEARHEAQMTASQEKLQLLERAEERLKQQFEQLANQLFDVKTAKVDQQNKQSLEGLLNPLKLQLEGFRKQVNDSFTQEAKERHTLVHELKNLQRLNEQMAQEALNLTQALKGDNKQQGNWGEVVLARVLAESGLREGHEYQTQVSLQNESGKRYQPDVIVNLPNDKQVVIDSKMALVAYERYYHAENDEARDKALGEHLLAIRTHLKGLSHKDYQQLKGIQTLDYVLMFIPVEPAFQLAIQAEPALVKDAMEQNIIIVSPTTLLVALRTIDNLWRNEYQNQNAQLIAEKAGKLYDKLRLFVDDMDALGSALEKAGQNYQGAMNKLVSGRGNAIRQAESFKQLGVEVKRPIASRWVDESRKAASEEESAEENLPIAERHPTGDKVN
ncbi:DNA recombination protein RmuC [Vibrio mangrovi]|nr:DNA recombination protein RmuC [Vibrio mangrovi]MDW6002547.1 DNA recombination protein RmuC [Vibrio mangrovi]